MLKKVKVNLSYKFRKLETLKIAGTQKIAYVAKVETSPGMFTHTLIPQSKYRLINWFIKLYIRIKY